MFDLTLQWSKRPYDIEFYLSRSFIQLDHFYTAKTAINTKHNNEGHTMAAGYMCMTKVNHVPYVYTRKLAVSKIGEFTHYRSLRRICRDRVSVEVTLSLTTLIVTLKRVYMHDPMISVILCISSSGQHRQARRIRAALNYQRTLVDGTF